MDITSPLFVVLVIVLVIVGAIIFAACSKEDGHSSE